MILWGFKLLLFTDLEYGSELYKDLELYSSVYSSSFLSNRNLFLYILTAGLSSFIDILWSTILTNKPFKSEWFLDNMFLILSSYYIFTIK